MNEKPTPNQLTLKISNAEGRELQAMISLVAIQDLCNKNGEPAVADCIYGIFKQLCEKMKQK